jgi:hypothetical protein
MLVLTACSGGGEPAIEEPAATETAAPVDDFMVGRPQNRAGVGDVQRAFDRYEPTRADAIALFKEQEWYRDGLTRDESLFVERALTFSSRQRADRATISAETIRRKLFVYEKVTLSRSEVELLLIYEPNQQAEREFALLRAALPVLEELVGVQYPWGVMTVINGPFEINDFDDGQFIRIARCCPGSSFVLAHELAHSYWSMGPSWFNEGMADIYAIQTIERLQSRPPAGWTSLRADLESHYRSRKIQVDSGRYPNILLPRRLASDGLYEVADVFLLDIRRVLGADAFASAAQAIYSASDFGRYNLREKRIEDVFLQFTKAGDRDEVMSLFNRQIWGDNGEKYRELVEQEGP